LVPTVYEALNQAVLEAIPTGVRRVLDLGCGSGALGREVQARLGASVTGVSASPEEVARGRAVLNTILQQDLDTWDGQGVDHPFDVIICSHVLEHLREPERLLRVLSRKSAKETTLLVALPNILHWRQRTQFLRGAFRYSEGGIMDRTHLRFFDWESARKLLQRSGWKLSRAWATGHSPGVWRVPGLGPVLDRWCCRIAPGLFGDQFLLLGTPSESWTGWSPTR
jgi:methionine biosynthesis protein MetW